MCSWKETVHSFHVSSHDMLQSCFSYQSLSAYFFLLWVFPCHIAREIALLEITHPNNFKTYNTTSEVYEVFVKDACIWWLSGSCQPLWSMEIQFSLF